MLPAIPALTTTMSKAPRAAPAVQSDVGGDVEDAVAFASHFGKLGVASAANGHVDAGTGQRQRDGPTVGGAAAKVALYQRIELVLADRIRPLHTRSPSATAACSRPVGIGETRPPQRQQFGAAGHQDWIDISDS
ncbi:hypothetical protein NKH58_30365 [Mesorhizobium australicum]